MHTLGLALLQSHPASTTHELSHPSPRIVPSSSQPYDPIATIPSPHYIAVHVLRPTSFYVHSYPFSIVQVSEHPSPETGISPFPSSHSSFPARIESPHYYAMQVLKPASF